MLKRHQLNSPLTNGAGDESTMILSDQSINTNNTLIIGWNQESLNLFDKIKSHPALGYNVRGFISVSDDAEISEYKGIPLLGGLKTLESWAHLFSIRKILIAIEPAYENRLMIVIELCKKIGLNYKIVQDVYDTVYGIAIRDVYEDLFSREEIGLRRIIDFTGASILMILLFPLFLFTAIAIKLESKGSIFYSQIRVGRRSKQFRIYKFRTMVQNAEKQSGPVWAQKDDPRITRVGRFLRATRIDEIPQLMNMLKGDMSFIGPRPERPFFVESFKQQIPLYEKRLSVKPGVTGWAQVKWRYDETLEDVREKLNYDLYYINNHTLLLDIKIFFLTISTVLLQKGQ